jgi:hypothetical protein
MASYKEMQAVANDPVRFRSLARRLLLERDLTDWELDFLENLAANKALKALSTRQSEKLMELRDDMERISNIDGFSVSSLINSCTLARDDLDDADTDFIETLKTKGASSIKRKHRGRLLRCCRRLGVIDK